MKVVLICACALGCGGFVGVMNAVAAADAVSAVSMESNSNPYSVISDRNVFHLNPPPPPPAPPEAKPLDLPKVMLTGFIGRGNSTKVLLAIAPKDAKEGPVYLSLLPSEKEHDVELVSIRLEKEEVDIINAGTPQTLSVKSNSYAATAVAPPAGKGGPPGMPQGIGLRHLPPGFAPRGAPAPFAPAAASAVAPNQGGGSTIIAGGGSGSSVITGGGSSFGGYNSSAGSPIVSGGQSYAPTAPVAANGVGAQIANTLFNPQTGHYQMPAPSAPPLPPQLQHAAMILTAAAGGPPAVPAAVQEAEAAEAADQGQPPPSLPSQ